MNWLYNDFCSGNPMHQDEDVWVIFYSYSTTDGKKFIVEYKVGGGTGDTRITEILKP